MQLLDSLVLFHTGIVVDDLDASMAAMSAFSPVRWAPPRRANTPMMSPGGHIPREVRFTYSLDGPHHIELLEQVDPTPYESLTGGRRIHHLGYLTDNLEADARRLDDLGFRQEMYGFDEHGAISRASYHYSELFPGMWIELVDAETWNDFTTWIEKAIDAEQDTNG